MMLFRPKSTVAVSEYVWAFLSSPAGYREAARSVDGSAAPHINIQEVVAFRLPAPPLDFQREFSGCVGAIEKLKATHRAFRGEL
jgi:restriction endonuclease S subunit